MWTLGVLYGCILGGVLVAGLWPFHAPRNDVAWLGDKAGLRFGRHGTILSSGVFTTEGLKDQASGSLEIWLKPRLADASSTILAFYTPDSPLRFSLHQSLGDLKLQIGMGGGRQQSGRIRSVYVNNVLHADRLVFVAVTSGIGGTAVYVDAALAETFPAFRLPPAPFTGQLVAGTSPVVNDAWRGELRGLAIYDSELTPAQVAAHYRAWTATQPAISERNVALYLFNERAGSVARDSGASHIELKIPAQFTIVNEKFLEPPWKEFRLSWSYSKNVLINIFGFIPLGFFSCAFLSAWRLKQAGPVAIAAGAAVSLTIEVLQAFLPTRDSGLTDLITNTFGTYLGVILYRRIYEYLNRLLFMFQ